jgi:hypothetical protein
MRARVGVRLPPPGGAAVPLIEPTPVTVADHHARTGEWMTGSRTPRPALRHRPGTWRRDQPNQRLRPTTPPHDAAGTTTRLPTPRIRTPTTPPRRPANPSQPIKTRDLTGPDPSWMTPRCGSAACSTLFAQVATSIKRPSKGVLQPGLVTPPDVPAPAPLGAPRPGAAPTPRSGPVPATPSARPPTTQRQASPR